MWSVVIHSTYGVFLTLCYSNDGVAVAYDPDGGSAGCGERCWGIRSLRWVYRVHQQTSQNLDSKSTDNFTSPRIMFQYTYWVLCKMAILPKILALNWQLYLFSQTINLLHTSYLISLLNWRWPAIQAGRNFDSSYSMDVIRGMMGVKDTKRRYYGSTERSDFDLTHSLPKFFDSRRAWPHCESLEAISDQGACGSCWVSRLTDYNNNRMIGNY